MNSNMPRPLSVAKSIGECAIIRTPILVKYFLFCLKLNLLKIKFPIYCKFFRYFENSELFFNKNLFLIIFCTLESTQFSERIKISYLYSILMECCSTIWYNFHNFPPRENLLLIFMCIFIGGLKWQIFEINSKFFCNMDAWSLWYFGGFGYIFIYVIIFIILYC